MLDVPGFHHTLSPRAFSEAGFTRPGEALTKHRSDVSQEKVAELQAEPAGRWPKGRDSSDSRRSVAAGCTGVIAAPHLGSPRAARCCPLLLLGEYSHSAAVLPHITKPFVFHFTWIP